MNSLRPIVAGLTAITLLGAVLSVGTSGLHQQVSATPNEPSNPCKPFKELIKDFEKAFLDAVAEEPPDPKKMQLIVDDFRDNLAANAGIFQNPEAFKELVVDLWGDLSNLVIDLPEIEESNMRTKGGRSGMDEPISDFKSDQSELAQQVEDKC